MLRLLNPWLSREPVIIIYKKQSDLKGSVVMFTRFNAMSLWYFNRTAAQLKGELGMEDQELLSACARIQWGWGFPALAVPQRADLVPLGTHLYLYVYDYVALQLLLIIKMGGVHV